jgi:hypothetical protein
MLMLNCDACFLFHYELQCIDCRTIARIACSILSGVLSALNMAVEMQVMMGIVSALGGK